MGFIYLDINLYCWTILEYIKWTKFRRKDES